MIQSTLDFLRGDALGEEIKRVDIAAILETVYDRLVDIGHDVALRGGNSHAASMPADQQKRWRSVGHHHVVQATSLPGVSNRM